MKDSMGQLIIREARKIYSIVTKQIDRNDDKMLRGDKKENLKSFSMSSSTSTPSFDNLKNLYDNYIVNKFHKPSALFVFLFITIWPLLGVHFLVKNTFDYEWYAYTLTIAIIIIFWLIFKYCWPYRKNKPDAKSGREKTGIVIAIFAENYEGIKIKNLFIKELKRNFVDTNIDKYFNIMPLLNHHAEKIKTKNNVDELHKKVGGHIYFYGDIQKEADGKNVNKYFLNIDGYVKHWPVPIPVSQELSFDFRAVLPKEINFEEFFALRGCKATAKIVYLTTKYVVGATSFISGNPFLAFEMHKNMISELDDYKKIAEDKNIKELAAIDFKQIKQIKNKIPLMLSNECFVIAHIYYINRLFNKAFELLTASLKYNKCNYDTYCLKALYAFQITNDPLEAFRNVKAAQKYAKNRIEWRYDYAFLKFWFGEFEEAFKMCKKINVQYYAAEHVTLNNVESFNLDLLKNNQDKPQLYFWIGYLNHKKKNNLPKALEYFEKFVKLSSATKMNFLLEKSKAFLVEIKKEMQI